MTFQKVFSFFKRILNGTRLGNFPITPEKEKKMLVCIFMRRRRLIYYQIEQMHFDEAWER